MAREWPQERRYTAKAVCAAAAMSYSDLNYREHEGLLQRLSRPRKPHKRKTYSVGDIIALAIAQRCVDLGMSFREALSWGMACADERNRLPNEGAGILEIRYLGDSQHVFFHNPKLPPVPAKLAPPSTWEVMVAIDADRIAERVVAVLDGFKPQGARSVSG
jgi:hypothetical protein